MDLHDTTDVVELTASTSDYILDSSWAVWDSVRMTVEFWMQSSNTANTTVVSCVATPAGTMRWKIYFDAFGQLTFEGPATRNWGSSVTLHDGAPHHVAVTVGTFWTDFYVDGIHRARHATYDYSLVPTTCALAIGVDQSSAGGGFHDPIAAKIWDFRFWNSEDRSADEIFANYQHRLTGSETNLETYWKMDEGTGSTVEDSTSNNEDGTITGSVWSTTDTSFLTDVQGWMVFCSRKGR
jgi:hypothetical protein